MLFPTKMLLHHYPDFSHHGSLEPCGIMAEIGAPFVDVLEAESQTRGQNPAITSGRASALRVAVPEVSTENISQGRDAWSSWICTPDLLSVPLEPQLGVEGSEMCAWISRLGSQLDFRAAHPWCCSCNPKICFVVPRCCVWLPTGGIVEWFGLEKTLRIFSLC